MIYLYKRRSIFDKYKLVGKYDSLNKASGIANVNISQGYDILISSIDIKEAKKVL